MILSATHAECQIPCLQSIATGMAELPRQSLLRRLKLLVRRNLDPRRERKLKTVTNDLANWFSKVRGKATKPNAVVAAASGHLRAGEMVCVKSQAEIEATLNNWRQLKGCTFMPEMVQYCGSTQRVLKPLRRFVDERDLRAKKCSGIVLLTGAVCQGTADFGPCDRSCFLFWREEWLEKIAE
jgi:hypothetical protein